MKAFDDSLVFRFGAKPDVLRFLLSHPRKQTCINHLCREIVKIERSSVRIIFDVSVYKKTISDVSNMFAAAALQQAEERSLSELEISRRVTEAGKIKAAEEMMTDLEKEATDPRVRSFRGAVAN